MQHIIPHLWFDKEAKEAAAFYTSILPDSSITHISTLHNTPSGDTDIVSFTLAGQSFMAISAGPYFKLNPSVSFHIRCKTVEEVDKIWDRFSEGAKVLMELGEYPFSKRYGWLQDKFGLSWQISHAGDEPFTQRIIPVITYVGNVAGKAGEAIGFYTSIFSKKIPNPPSKILMSMKYGKGEEPDKEGTIKYAAFTLLGQEFGAMDSAHEHDFSFSEAISFMINCDTQEEIDYFWEQMSADPKAEQCGWLKDKFGLSWQVTPTILGDLMNSSDQKRVARVTEAFMKMKKFDIAALKKAAEGT